MKSHSRTSEFLQLSATLTQIQLSSSTTKDADIRRTIFYALKDMGGVYFKCLQILSVTHKFLEGWASPAEMSVFNSVPLEPIDIAAHLSLANFRSIDPTPVAAGSFAQVYRGTLLSGESVAIKILRPSIAKNLKRDVKYLKRLASLFAKFLPASIVDYKAFIAEFSRICITETDYAREIANMEYFAKFYAGHPHVIIPRVYKELSTPTVIVQQFIEGPTFADCLTSVTPTRPATLIAKELTGSNLWTQLIIAGGEAIRMAITADFVFGDPHPGNVKLLKDNKIALIDFGIIAPKPTSQRAFYDWIKAYRDALSGGELGQVITTSLACFCPDLSVALNSAVTGDTPFVDTLANAITAKFTSIKHSSSLAQNLSSNGHFFRLFTDALDSNNSLGLILDTHNFALIKALQGYLGSLTVLDNNETGDRFSSAMSQAIDYGLTSAEQSGVPTDLPAKSKYSRSDALTLLADTLSSLAGGDEFLFQYVYANI